MKIHHNELIIIKIGILNFLGNMKKLLFLGVLLGKVGGGSKKLKVGVVKKCTPTWETLSE